MGVCIAEASATAKENFSFPLPAEAARERLETGGGFFVPTAILTGYQQGDLVADKAKQLTKLYGGTVISVVVENEAGDKSVVFFKYFTDLAFDRKPSECFPDEYYEQFEAHPERHRTLAQTLPVFVDTPEFVRLRGIKAVNILVLGSAFSGNYPALVNFSKEQGIDSRIIVVDYNRTPLFRLISERNSGRLTTRPQDSWIVGDITEMPFPFEFFEAMYGDYILNCLPPNKIDAFFRSLAAHLTKDGAAFLSVGCNSFFEAHGLKHPGLPVFSISYGAEDYKTVAHYFYGELDYYREMAEKWGLNFREVKRQPRQGNREVSDHYIVVSKQATI